MGRTCFSEPARRSTRSKPLFKRKPLFRSLLLSSGYWRKTRLVTWPFWQICSCVEPDESVSQKIIDARVVLSKGHFFVLCHQLNPSDLPSVTSCIKIVHLRSWVHIVRVSALKSILCFSLLVGISKYHISSRRVGSWHPRLGSLSLPKTTTWKDLMKKGSAYWNNG